MLLHAERKGALPAELVRSLQGKKISQEICLSEHTFTCRMSDTELLSQAVLSTCIIRVPWFWIWVIWGAGTSCFILNRNIMLTEAFGKKKNFSKKITRISVPIFSCSYNRLQTVSFQFSKREDQSNNLLKSKQRFENALCIKKLSQLTIQ